MLQDLVRDKQFVVAIMKDWSVQHIRQHVHLVSSDEIMLDPDVALAALKCGFLSVSDLRPELNEDRSFWKTLIDHNPTLWDSAPIAFDFPHDRELALEMADFKYNRHDTSGMDEGSVRLFFERFPDFQDDLDVWSIIFDSEFLKYWPGGEVVLPYCTDPVFANFKLMKKACKKYWSVYYERLGPELQENEEIIKHADYSDVGKIPVYVQWKHKELIAQITSDISFRVEDLDRALFRDAEFVTKWLSTEKEDYGVIAQELWSNEDVALALAKCCDRQYGPPPFPFETYVPQELRQNRGFMTKVAEESDGCCSVLIAVNEFEVLRDFDFVVNAYSAMDTDEFVHYFLHDVLETEQTAFLRQVLAIAREKLESHLGFTNLLYGVAEFAGSDCPVSMLYGDEATTMAFKKHIAGNLGVPTGAEIQKLRKVVKNLDRLDCYCGKCRFWQFHNHLGDPDNPFPSDKKFCS